MRNNTGTIENKLTKGARVLNWTDPAIWFCFGFCLVLLSPIAPIAPWLQTFMHPWRPELAASLFLSGFLIWAYRNGDFRFYISGLNRQLLMGIILPCTAFIAWSFVSAAYAPSWRSALHHSLVWSIYVVFFLIAGYLL
jgi:hypothetical protein